MIPGLIFPLRELFVVISLIITHLGEFSLELGTFWEFLVLDHGLVPCPALHQKSMV